MPDICTIDAVVVSGRIDDPWLLLIESSIIGCTSSLEPRR